MLVIVGALAQYLPPIATALAIGWYLVLFYEKWSAYRHRRRPHRHRRHRDPPEVKQDDDTKL